MNINALHSNCGQGDKGAEERLFESLSVRFRLFAEHKIRDRLDAEEVCQKALNIFGGYGLMSEYPVQRHLRDSYFPLIGGGTSDIMRLIVARQLGLGG